MVTRDVIDLCLSTDDETNDAEAKSGQPIIGTKPIGGHGSLSERCIDTDEGPRKKRKLSEPEIEGPETLPLNSKTLLQGTKPSSSNINARDFPAFDDDDPIIWSSSPKRKTKATPRPPSDQLVFADLSDSDASLPDEEWLRTAQARLAQVPERVKQLTGSKSSGEKTKFQASDPKLNDKSGGGPSLQPRSHLARGYRDNSSCDESTKIDKPKTVKAKKPNITDEERASQARRKDEAKAATKAMRLQQKEELKEQKRLLKEEQAREKQKDKDRAEANRLKLDKKLSTPEMIVDLPLSIEGSKVDTQTREVLKGIGVEINSYHSPVPNLIKWRRKVESRFNPATGAREKLQMKEIDPKKHLMCLMSANEFVQLATSHADEDSSNLDKHVTRVRSALNDCIPIYLVEGLDAWMRKNKNAKNRAYQAAVLGQPDSHIPNSSTSGTNAASKRRQPRVEVVDEDMIEDALVRLQVMSSCLVHHTAAPVETAEWIAHFTEQISQIPYR
ncbi:MAG: hypothetical protein L6R40_005783 [Gallowayella cf. fulva]|nr:MAG: hypothetical protein L6R40_005783 [Xanthomendoza cf. fulva]